MIFTFGANRRRGNAAAGVVATDAGGSTGTAPVAALALSDTSSFAPASSPPLPPRRRLAGRSTTCRSAGVVALFILLLLVALLLLFSSLSTFTLSSGARKSGDDKGGTYVVPMPHVVDSGVAHSDNVHNDADARHDPHPDSRVSDGVGAGGGSPKVSNRRRGGGGGGDGEVGNANDGGEQSGGEKGLFGGLMDVANGDDGLMGGDGDGGAVGGVIDDDDGDDAAAAMDAARQQQGGEEEDGKATAMPGGGGGAAPASTTASGTDEEEAEEASFSSIMDAVGMNLTASAELLMGAFEEGEDNMLMNTSTTASLPVLDTAARVMLLSRREVALGGASPLPPRVLPLWRAVGYALVRSMMAKYEASRARYEGGRMGSPAAVPPPRRSSSVDVYTDDDSPFVPWLHSPLQCHNKTNGGAVCFRHVRHLAPSFGSEGYLPPSPMAAPYLSEHECLALCAGHDHCAGAVCTAVGGQANATSTIRSHGMMGTCRLVDGRLLQAYGAGGATDASFAARLGGVGPFTASDVPMGGGGGRGRKSLRVHLSTAAMHMLGMGGGGGGGGSLRAAQLRANSSRPFAPDRFQEGRAALHHYMLFCMLGTAGSIPRRVLPSLATWLFPYKALLFLDDEGAAVSGAIKAVLGPFLSASSGAPPPLKEGGAAAADGVGRIPSSPTDIKSPLLSLDVRRHWSSTQQGGWPGSLSDLYSSARGGGQQHWQQQGFKRCVFLRPPQAAAPAQHRKGDRPPLPPPPLAQQQGGVMRRRAISAKGIGGAWKNGQIVRYLALLPPQHRFPWYAIVDDDTHYIDWNFRALFSSVMGMGGGGGEHSDVKPVSPALSSAPTAASASAAVGDNGQSEAAYLEHVAVRYRQLWRQRHFLSSGGGGGSTTASTTRTAIGHGFPTPQRDSSPPILSTDNSNTTSSSSNNTTRGGDYDDHFQRVADRNNNRALVTGWRMFWGKVTVRFIHGGAGIMLNERALRYYSHPRVAPICAVKCAWAPHGDVRMGCCGSLLGERHVMQAPMLGWHQEAPFYVFKRRGGGGTSSSSLDQLYAFPTTFHRIDDSVDFAAFVDVATERARAFEERMRREDDAANANPDGADGGGDSSYYFPFIGYKWIREVYVGGGDVAGGG